MTAPRQPEETKRAKGGLKDGETPNTTRSKGGARSVEEEDAFGGAERTRKGKPVRSQDAKP
ncbi:MAG: hypothetical protein QM759_07750 [Terricaulis sp.]